MNLDVTQLALEQLKNLLTKGPEIIGGMVKKMKKAVDTVSKMDKALKNLDPAVRKAGEAYEKKQFNEGEKRMEAGQEKLKKEMAASTKKAHEKSKKLIEAIFGNADTAGKGSGEGSNANDAVTTRYKKWKNGVCAFPLLCYIVIVLQVFF